MIHRSVVGSSRAICVGLVSVCVGLAGATASACPEVAMPSPPPSSELEDPTNTVVRICTNMGVIDIELFDSIAPNTVANFLNYVDADAYDGTFVHRSVPGFVIQSGGFTFDDTTGLGFVPQDPPINNEFQRSNVERTVALAKLGGDPNSGRSQWFINLDDNAANLDNQNGGFTVFGRVVGEPSWVTVLAIEALPVYNRASLHGALSALPLQPPATPISQETLVFICTVDRITTSLGCDENNDMAISIADLLLFLTPWFAGDLSADRTGGGTVDLFDVLHFLDCYFA